MFSITHMALASASLVLGAFVLLDTKGTPRHRWMGRLYCFSMIGLNLAALGIYHLTGRFNLFHFTAILSLAMVLMGWAQVLLRHRLPNWLYRHYIYMCWSYVALVAATFNEGFVRLPPLKALAHHYGNWLILMTQAVLVHRRSFYQPTQEQDSSALWNHWTRMTLTNASV
jgi:uncharacterized membrane protein